jgi:carboxymethylenebutenolidase
MDGDQAADRDAARDYLVTPEVGRGPGVLVLHSGRGSTEFVTGFCQRLARDGFVALAPELFGGETPTTTEAAQAAKDAVDEHTLGSRLADTARFLRRHDDVSRPAVGVVGIGYGAALACRLLDRGALEPGALVLFYGLAPTDWSAVAAPVSGHFAQLDPELPESRVRELREQLDAGGVVHDLFVYPGIRPSFFETGATAQHDPDAAQLAWERTSRFLTAHLG